MIRKDISKILINCHFLINMLINFILLIFGIKLEIESIIQGIFLKPIRDLTYKKNFITI